MLNQYFQVLVFNHSFMFCNRAKRLTLGHNSVWSSLGMSFFCWFAVLQVPVYLLTLQTKTCQYKEIYKYKKKLMLSETCVKDIWCIGKQFRTFVILYNLDICQHYLLCSKSNVKNESHRMAMCRTLRNCIWHDESFVAIDLPKA